ncbi:glycosyl hydrolase [Marinobacter sp. M3C]|uniref:WD40/YVTN/BNR-like repeat-containing protein n=1 Tax=Marinobacter sp. M3C TaxID=2917715 RepID=UPI00200F5D5E|nr:YCF48-related protein [Marinobacter sp. M3C]MCL1477251.1 glycosyl hydrolase [Marinobacter sp.]MCL1480727.1 glycosyl hydrolase [Marinobacter sp.]MCL1486829.1 glycosyl hydrolase [Marinobacter sp.]UQG62412.1 glycosyl hydrolase [Marinobacter sp. M3C]
MPTAPTCHNGIACRALLLSSIASFLLTGCEAPLDLDTVREQSQNALKRTDFYQAMARNEGVIVLAGNTGALLHSEDNGETWTRTPLTTNDSFIAVDACPDGSFIALTFSNILWHGDASAINWTPYTLPSSEQMMTATCSPDGSWWAAGSFTTLQNSSDQGRTWAETSLNEDAILTNIQFLNNSQGVAAGEYGMLLATEDSGENWDYAGYLPDEFYPHAAWFTSRQKGWVGGLNGFIYHTTDGGESWTQQASETAAPIFGFVKGKAALYALGDNTTVLQLTQGEWVQLPTQNQPLYLRSGVALPDNHLLLAGGRGLLLNIETPEAASASTD